MAFGANQASACENAEVRRHGVLRHVELAGDFAGRQTSRFVADQQTEHIETRSLRQRTKRSDSRVVFHASSIADIWRDVTLACSCVNQVSRYSPDNGFREGLGRPVFRSQAGPDQRTLAFFNSPERL
jgi:hypothetical protein